MHAHREKWTVRISGMKQQILIHSSNANYSPFQSQSFPLISFLELTIIDQKDEQKDPSYWGYTQTAQFTVFTEANQQYFQSISFYPSNFHYTFYYICNIFVNRTCGNLQEVFKKFPPLLLNPRKLKQNKNTLVV